VGRNGEANPGSVRRKTRRAEDATNRLNGIAPVLSRAVDVPTRRVWIRARTITSWAMEAARPAQNRRGLADRSTMSSKRRVFRPTDPGFVSPIRPFAPSPFR
jgi:hypothetical protein